MKYDLYRDVIISGLKSIIRDQGRNVFTNEKRLKGFLDDYIPQIRGRQERKMLDAAYECGIFGVIANGYESDSTIYKKAKDRLSSDTFLSDEAIEALLEWLFKAFQKTIPSKTPHAPEPTPIKKEETTSVTVTPEVKSTSTSSSLSPTETYRLLELFVQALTRKIEKTAFIIAPNVFGLPTIFMPGCVYPFTFYGVSLNYKAEACVKCDGLDYLICSVPPFGGYAVIKIEGTLITYVDDEKLRDDIINHAKKEKWIL